MSQNTVHDDAYQRAQSRSTREAAETYQSSDRSTEDPRIRRTYDRELRRNMPVDGKGRRKR